VRVSLSKFEIPTYGTRVDFSLFQKYLYFFILYSPLWFFLVCWQIDSNTDGLVDFTEFVAATLHVHQLEEHDSFKWQQRSQAAFEKFDLDKDGYITPDELRMVGLMSFLRHLEHFFYDKFSLEISKY